MAANTVNIALPDPLRAYVEERVAEGDYATPSEFIRSLIREDRERRRERLEAVLMEALETRPLEVDPEELRGRSLVSVLREKLAHS
jgi:antitoxin ParD1/3/4